MLKLSAKQLHDFKKENYKPNNKLTNEKQDHLLEKSRFNVSLRLSKRLPTHELHLQQNCQHTPDDGKKIVKLIFQIHWKQLLNIFYCNYRYYRQPVSKKSKKGTSASKSDTLSVLGRKKMSLTSAKCLPKQTPLRVHILMILLNKHQFFRTLILCQSYKKCP
jgi:hypothetical protein